MTNTDNQNHKTKLAVFFGGRSPEHDVSVVSALQVMGAFDPALYDVRPVYVDPKGQMWTGDALLRRENYLLTDAVKQSLTPVTLDIRKTANGGGRLVGDAPKGLFRKDAPSFEFDVAFPVFHGINGEDGSLQGLFDFAGIAYAGMRSMASSVFMDKVATKIFLRSVGVNVLDCAVFDRPKQGYLIPQETIKDVLAVSGVEFPACLKPSHLGSSIGVAKVNSPEEIAECLPAIFQYDDTAILEPFVENLVEYNVSVSRLGDGQTKLSAIERPKSGDELLDFKQKYLSGSGKGGLKMGQKQSAGASEGMLSLTRDINPDIPDEMRKKIERWAITVFDSINGSGAPRIDFIVNSKTGDIWMNEVNPCPGSLGYFLWEEAPENPLLFTEFLGLLVDEALRLSKSRVLPADPVPADARLLSRP